MAKKDTTPVNLRVVMYADGRKAGEARGAVERWALPSVIAQVEAHVEDPDYETAETLRAARSRRKPKGRSVG